MNTTAFRELIIGVSEYLGWPIVPGKYDESPEQIFLAPPDPSDDGVLYRFRVNEYRQKDRIVINPSHPSWWNEVRRGIDDMSLTDFTLAETSSVSRIASRVLASWRDEVQPKMLLFIERRKEIEENNRQRRRDVDIINSQSLPWIRAAYQTSERGGQQKIAHTVATDLRNRHDSTAERWLGYQGQHGGDYSDSGWSYIELSVRVPVDKLKEFDAFMERIVPPKKAKTA